MNIEIGTYSDTMPKWKGWIAYGNHVVFLDRDGNISKPYPRGE